MSSKKKQTNKKTSSNTSLNQATKSASKKPTAASQVAFDLEILKASHPAIKKLKREYPTSIHGNKFWGSSFLLMDYFRKHPLQSSAKVLELGCGWGLASIYLNKNYACNVTGVDADSDVFPYADLHADINGAKISTLVRRFEKLSKAELANYDVIIAADVCFWDELTDIHFNLIRRALKAGVATIIYADPERSPFTTLAQRCEAKLHKGDVSVSYRDARVKSLKASGQLLLIEQ